MNALNQARHLYINYKTTTPQYKALAAQLGYADTGALNQFFAIERSNARYNKG